MQARSVAESSKRRIGGRSGVLSIERPLGIIVSHDIGVMPLSEDPDSTWLIIRYGARCGRDAAGFAGRRK
jgi:hypothetical protein